MANIFNSIKLRQPARSRFDLSHDVKLSCDMGKLVPTLMQECLPGDKFDLSVESMIRFAPMIAPVMHMVDVTHHYFFVPNRILWSNWETFITGGEDGMQTPAMPYVRPQIVAGSLGDYLGIPPGNYSPDLDTNFINALPFAAYQAIYNEYYRDQNLQAPVTYKLVNGWQFATATATLTQIRNRAWQHDYFTASLPWAQKGPAVTLPMGAFGDVDVYLDNNGYGYNQTLIVEDGNNIPDGSPLEIASGGGAFGNFTADDGVTARQVNLNPNGSLKADTSALVVNATTINELRRAVSLQSWLEKNARGGSRYVESILSHFATHAGDYRLDRPEYIGGSKSHVQFSEVLQTSQTSGANALAQMAGHGLSTPGGKRNFYKCKEHGYIVSIMSVMPKTAYQQGIEKHYFRRSRLDFAWPDFAHLGEQEVKNKELYFIAGDAANEATFGYVPRNAEYKYNNNRVAGEFRSSLSFWHLGRIFSARPGLNSTFIEADPSTRIFAVTSGTNNKLYCHVFHRISAQRPLPKFGTPQLIG